MAKENYTILIICEGEKTEPYFFNAIRDELLENKFDNDIRNLIVTIAPEPLIEETNIDAVIKHKKKRKKRNTKQVINIDNLEIEKGQPPLRWVKTAKRELATGAFNEVWTVFDNDNHPAKKEAFEEAEETINGNRIKIAYSSRSFEYYLLSHFEQIYKIFNRTDCKFKTGKKDIFTRCGTNLHPEIDCKGDLCINGYAQTKGFWDNTSIINSKNSETYTLIKDKLEIGFENSSWLRFKSRIIQSQTPIYDRNPYLSVDKLIKVLVGNNEVHKWLELDKAYNFTKFSILINIENKSIEMTNTSNTTIILSKNSVFAIDERDGVMIGERQVINPNETININLPKGLSEKVWFKFKYEEYVLMFENKA